jgi:hypothetical protein
MWVTTFHKRELRDRSSRILRLWLSLENLPESGKPKFEAEGFLSARDGVLRRRERSGCHIWQTPTSLVTKVFSCTIRLAAAIA